MSTYEVLSSPAYWEPSTLAPSRGIERIRGIPDDLASEMNRILASPGGMYAEALEAGVPFEEVSARVPLHLRASPWVLKVVTDSARQGKTAYPDGWFMGRDQLVEPQAFDAIAQELLAEHLPSVGSVAAYHAETGTKGVTLRREVAYCLGRTMAGTAIDCTVNDMPCLPGLPRKRLDSESIFRSFLATVDLGLSVGDVYSDKTGRVHKKIAAATLLVARDTISTRPPTRIRRAPVAQSVVYPSAARPVAL